MTSLLSMALTGLIEDLFYVADATSFDAGMVGSGSSEPAEGFASTFVVRDLAGVDHVVTAVWGRNTSGAAIAQYALAKFKVGSAVEVLNNATVTQPNAALFGVCAAGLADGERGWFVRSGVFYGIDSGAGWTAGDKLMSSATSGTLEVNNIGSIAKAAGIIGVAYETATAGQTKLVRYTL